MLCCRHEQNTPVLQSILGQGSAQTDTLLSCPLGFLVSGLQAHDGSLGLDYLDVSLKSRCLHDPWAVPDKKMHCPACPACCRLQLRKAQLNPDTRQSCDAKSTA